MELGGSLLSFMIILEFVGYICQKKILKMPLSIVFQYFYNMVNTQLHAQIQILRTDNEG